MKKTLIALAVIAAPFAAQATDCGCTKTPTAYDKTQDVKIGSLQDRDAQLAADIHTVHMNTLTKYSESWGLEDRTNIADLQESKVDKAVFTADQQRQDAQTAGYVAAQVDRDAGQDQHINAVQDVAQNASVHADALAVRADGIEQRATVTDNRSINNAVRLDGVETVNSQQGQAITQLYANGEYAQSRIDTANANIEANRAAQVASNKRIAANTQQLQNHEQRLGTLEQSTSRGFADMGKRIDKVQDRANAGVSAAFASAGIPQVTDGQRFAMGAGVGGYEGENALAVGFSTRITHAVVLKASVASDSQSGFGYNAGVSVGW